MNKLRPYQVEGVNWMVFNWHNGRNSILADEMGLGKTVQTLQFLKSLRTRQNVRAPFLVVAPLSTLPHWQRESLSWTQFNTVVYHGDAASRETIRDFEFWEHDGTGEYDRKKFTIDVLITTCVGNRAVCGWVWVGRLALTWRWLWVLSCGCCRVAGTRSW